MTSCYTKKVFHFPIIVSHFRLQIIQVLDAVQKTWSFIHLNNEGMFGEKVRAFQVDDNDPTAYLTGENGILQVFDMKEQKIDASKRLDYR